MRVEALWFPSVFVISVGRVGCFSSFVRLCASSVDEGSESESSVDEVSSSELFGKVLLSSLVSGFGFGFCLKGNSSSLKMTSLFA